MIQEDQQSTQRTAHALKHYRYTIHALKGRKWNNSRTSNRRHIRNTNKITDGYQQLSAHSLTADTSNRKLAHMTRIEHFISAMHKVIIIA